MSSERTMLVEFLAVVGIVLIFAILATVLAVNNIDSGHPLFTSLIDGIKVLLGAVIALAYAARSVIRKNGK